MTDPLTIALEGLNDLDRAGILSHLLGYLGAAARAKAPCGPLTPEAAAMVLRVIEDQAERCTEARKGRQP